MRFAGIDPKLLEHPQWFKDNDKYGNPDRYEYGEAGLVSPTTLRYVKVAAEPQARPHVPQLAASLALAPG